VIGRPSEATPETERVPETVEPLAGEVIDTEGGAGETMLMLRLAEAEALALSFTTTVKGKVPATVGVPEMVPDELELTPWGKAPLRRLQR